jgi:flagellar basal body rod protein FlgC
MQSALHIAASGLRHADTRQRATAHNTANQTTAQTQVVRALGAERPVAGGVETHIEARPKSRPHLAAADTSPVKPPGPASVTAAAPAVEQMVEQISTVHQAGALGNVVRITDDMLGSLLDILG